MLYIVVYIIGLVLIWKRYSSFHKKYYPRPEKETKKNMNEYYSNISDDRSSKNFFGWVLFIYIVLGFLVFGDGDYECVPSSGWFGFC